MTRLALIAALLLALFASQGTAATQHHHEPHPLADQTAAWLTDVLGVEVPAQRVGVLDHHEYPLWQAASFPVYGSRVRYILARPRYYGEWSRGRASLDGATLLMHELLHGVSLDEGAVEAVALDLVPSWMARFSPVRIRWAWHYSQDIGNSAYPQLVDDVRGRSAFETGKSWRSREARLWRRAYLLETGQR